MFGSERGGARMSRRGGGDPMCRDGAKGTGAGEWGRGQGGRGRVGETKAQKRAGETRGKGSVGRNVDVLNYTQL